MQNFHAEYMNIGFWINFIYLLCITIMENEIKSMGGFNCFKNLDALRDEYIPDILLFRDEERKDIITHLQCFLMNITDGNIYILGPPSTGKTHMVKKIMNEFEAMNMDYRIYYVSLKNRTFLEAISELCNTSPKSSPYLSLREFILQQKTPFTIVFDEVDKVKPTTDYSFSAIINYIVGIKKLRENFNKEIPDYSLIIISNKDIYHYLDEGNKSIFTFHAVVFRKYTNEEIYEIVKDRCKKVYVDGVIDEDTISYLVSKVASFTDLRFTFSVLREANKILITRNETKITSNIIDEAFKNAEKEFIRKLIINLNRTEKDILYCIAYLQKKKKREVTSTEVYSLYKLLGGLLSFGHISNVILLSLELNGLICSEVRGLGKGRGKARFLWIDERMLDIVYDELNNEIEKNRGDKNE